MNIKHQYLLLNIISNNLNVKQLTREGLSYSDIAELTKSLITNGYLIDKDDSILLSEKGEQRLEELKPIYKKNNKNLWIEKDEKNQIKKLDKNTIFVPRQDELTFKIS